MKMTDTNKNHYVPALKYSWLTRFYDPIVAMTTREQVFRKSLLEQARVKPGSQILDLGCGTGTFAVMLKNRYPDTKVTGLDCDPDILFLAQKKAMTAGVDILFDESLSYSTPYAEGAFDSVFSSLFFHHLGSVEKLRTIWEVFRVLKPGGQFHVCDWGRPSSLISKIMFTGVRFLDGFEVTRDNVEGRLPSFISKVGFVGLHDLSHIETMLGTLDLFSAKKPSN